jgi:molybdopterin converting factor small subunit
MSISFKINASMFDFKEEVNLEVKGKTVSECFDYSIRQQPSLKQALFDANGVLYPGSIIKVNEEYMLSDALTKDIKDGDSIEIFKFRGC